MWSWSLAATRAKTTGRSDSGSVAKYNDLLDEEHLLVGRQRPEVVGDEDLELIAGGADGVHGREDDVAGVLGVRHGVARDGLRGRPDQRGGRGLERVDRAGQLGQQVGLRPGDAATGAVQGGDRARDL